MSPEIVIKLSAEFNTQVREGNFRTEAFRGFTGVLRKYGAKVAPSGPDAFFHVTEMKSPDVDGMLTELRQAKGVEAAYKKPPSACP